MATLIQSAPLENGGIVLVLTGKTHARRQQLSRPTPYMPMAGLLPRESTRSFTVGSNGGGYWACAGPEDRSSPPVCGPQVGPPPTLVHPRGLVVIHRDAAYDGWLNLGTETTASQPLVTGIAPP